MEFKDDVTFARTPGKRRAVVYLCQSFCLRKFFSPMLFLNVSLDYVKVFCLESFISMQCSLEVLSVDKECGRNNLYVQHL